MGIDDCYLSVVFGAVAVEVLLVIVRLIGGESVDRLFLLVFYEVNVETVFKVLLARATSVLP